MYAKKDLVGDIFSDRQTEEAKAELLQVRSFKGAATITAGALNLAAIPAPVINFTKTTAAGAVKNGSGHDQISSRQSGMNATHS